MCNGLFAAASEVDRHVSLPAIILALTLPLATIAGCSDSGGDSDDADDSDDAQASADGGDGDGSAGSQLSGGVTWHQNIAPVVAEHCVSCHTEGGIAPFAMDTYGQTSMWAELMASATASGLMPPWHAIETDECQSLPPLRHDARLDEATIDLFRAWADAGAPEGDAGNAAALPQPPSLGLADPTVTLTMGGEVTVEQVGGDLDHFHCMRLDPGNTEDVYLEALQVITGNRAILHHVLVYADPNSASDSFGPEGVERDCNGGTGVSDPDVHLIGAWVPGSLPAEPPDGVRTVLEAGTKVIMQVHYHATGAGPETDDATGLALRWSTQRPRYVSRMTLVGNFRTEAAGLMPGPADDGPQGTRFLIPAGATDHTEDMVYTVPTFSDRADVRVWTIANHMHKVGVSMRAWIERDGEDDVCLLDTPRWDFDWQRLYEYDVPIEQAPEVRSGDRLRIRCTYDNSLDNPGVVEALAEVGEDAPRDVRLGEGTLDEMCLAGVGIGVGLK